MYSGDASQSDASSEQLADRAGATQPVDPVFAAVLSLLRERVKKPVFDSWFARLSFLSIEDDVLRIGTPNVFVKEWIEKDLSLREKLAVAVRDAYGRPLTPDLVILTRPDDTPENGTKTQPAIAPAPVAATTAPPAPPPKRGVEADSTVQLKEEFTFESYVVGPKSNSLAHAAANAVAKHPGREFNPLFVHSAVGLGKTHLLQATCHELLKQRTPPPRILYLSCEEFLNRYVTAIKDKTLEPFRQKHRSVDVLVIDDIHFLADKPQFQEEFFHTFNALHNAHRQIILSADCHPSEIPTLEDRLVSRFNSGLVAKIDPPEFETRCAIIKRKASQRGQDLDDEVVQLLAQRIDSNIREIEGALNRLIGTASLSNVRIDKSFARACLSDVLGDESGHVHIHDIAEAVVARMRVKLTDLQSKRRTKKIANARQVCMYLARELTEMTLADIGGHFGGRDHTTVLYAIEKVERQLADSPEFRAMVEEVKREARARRSGGAP